MPSSLLHTYLTYHYAIDARTPRVAVSELDDNDMDLIEQTRIAESRNRWNFIVSVIKAVGRRRTL